MKKEIEFPTDAIEVFNRKAEEILGLLRTEKDSKYKKKKHETSDDHAFKEQLDIAISDAPQYSEINMLGEETSRYFSFKSGFVGLSGDEYRKFDELVHSIIKKPELRNLIGERFLKDSLFEWLKKRFKGELSKKDDFVSFMISNIKRSIKVRKIALPISNLIIEKPFKIGDVTFDFFRKDMFDKIEISEKTKTKEEGENKQRYFKRLRKKFQGVVYTSISIEAEKIKSIEVAKRKTENALVLLRFFSPSSIIPMVPAYYDLMGKSEVPTRSIFIYENELPAIVEGIDEMREFRRFISDSEFQELRKMGLNRASELIEKERKNKFENLVIDSLFLFSRAVESRLFQDKLVLTLVSLETLLLKDASESIQHSVALRIAFLTASTIEARKETIAIIKKAYKLRGAYLHHGKRKQPDIGLLASLQMIVWTAIINVLSKIDQYFSKNDFLAAIEEQILSG